MVPEMRDRARFSREKYFCPQNWEKLGKWTKNEPKIGYFEFIEKCGH